MTIAEGLSLNPLQFLSFEVDCYRAASPDVSIAKKKHQLPVTSPLSGEEAFATVYFAWHPEGVLLEALVEEPVTHVSHPNPEQGDSVEFFLDCRDVKTSGYNTRFCHHFFFLPKEVDGVSCGEITRFRTDDAHELADAGLLRADVKTDRNGYRLKVFIPRECLHGYDPEEFGRLGFSYRINRNGQPAQHFSSSSADFVVEQQPSLWSTLNLK